MPQTTTRTTTATQNEHASDMDDDETDGALRWTCDESVTEGDLGEGGR